jgi:hypothetical protein
MKTGVFGGPAALVAVLLGCLLSSPAYGYSQLGPPTLNPGENLRLETGIVNGLVVDRYTWRDAKGRPRSASLVRYGQRVNGAPRGGYAGQFSYQVRVPSSNTWRTVYLNPPDYRGDAGFGYFVSHELLRTFDANVCPDGSNYCAIAHVHGEDDSPFSLAMPGSGRRVSFTNGQAIHEFKLTYPHWGTTVPVSDASSEMTPSDPALHRKYNLPVTIRWTFTSGRDYPLWAVTYVLSPAPVNTVWVDMRGPYGYLNFAPAAAPLTRLEWGDSRKFATTGTSVSTSSGWAWNALHAGARYNLLVAGVYEMGLVQTIPYLRSRTGHPWSSARGRTSAQGPGCPDAGWRMPCDWQWPYQSIQYEDFDTSPSRIKKIAWGTAAYLGTNKSRDDTGGPIVGYPAISYGVWITFADSAGASTRNLAASIR